MTGKGVCVSNENGNGNECYDFMLAWAKGGLIGGTLDVLLCCSIVTGVAGK
jgi:hypothetical protein